MIEIWYPTWENVHLSEMSLTSLMIWGLFVCVHYWLPDRENEIVDCALGYYWAKFFTKERGTFNNRNLIRQWLTDIYCRDFLFNGCVIQTYDFSFNGKKLLYMYFPHLGCTSHHKLIDCFSIRMLQMQENRLGLCAFNDQNHINFDI